MQILPTTSSSTSRMELSSQSSGRDELGFSRLVSDFMDGSPAEVTPSFDPSAGLNDTYSQPDSGSHGSSYALTDSNAHSSPGQQSSGQQSSGSSSSAASEEPVRQDDPYVSSAPYLQAPTDLNPAHAPQEIRFTDDEIRKFAAGLEKQGVDREIIAQMQALMGNPMGVSAADLVKAMMQTVRKPAQVTDMDLKQIQSFVSRLDTDGTLTDAVLGDIRAGRTNQAWQRIVDSMRSMDQNSKVSFDKDELMALGKGLGLSSSTLDALRKAMGQRQEALMSPAMFEKLMTPAQHELGERKAQLEKLAGAIDKALATVAQEARVRIADEQAASARSVRSVDHSKFMIEDTVTQKGLAQTQPQPQPSSADAVLAAASRVQARTKTDSDNAGGENAHSGEKRNDAESFSARKGEKWDALLQRVRVDNSSTPMASSLFAQTAATSANVPIVAPSASLPGNYAPQVLRQVEQGVLSAMRNGGTRLELQLAPAELGTVTVVLTMKNGEVSAMLRPERNETTALLNQQTDLLRSALEQQGLKVDKVEVQTQLQDQRQGTSWQGMDQHNMQREKQTRSEEQERMQRLGRIGRMNRQDRADAMLPGSLLDRNMQGTKSPAGLAGGLYIVT